MKLFIIEATWCKR